MYFRKPSHYVSVRSLHLDTSHYYDKLKDPDYLSHLANGKYRQKKLLQQPFYFIQSCGSFHSSIVIP